MATEINNQKKLAASKRVPIKTVANSKSKSIKTSSKSKVKNADVGAGSIRPKRSSMVSILNESTIEGTLETKPIFQLTTKKFVTALISVFLLSSTITYGITHKLDSNSPTTTTFLAKISGGVALSESELIDVITQLKRNVYWTGPEKGAKYTVNALTDGQTYIRYLPGGKGVSDTLPKYRTVGTYESEDAYTATLAAGNEANGVSFTTADGRVIHYNKSSSDNVYLAYKGKPYQIEIFDPNPETALKMANDNKVEAID